MKIAVTGKNGQLALSLLDVAPGRSMQVIPLARPQFDLLNPQSIETAVAALNADVVVNAAAYTAVDRAEAEQDAAIAVNAFGAGCLARACAKRGLPIIHISTDYVFDGRKATAYVESDLRAPLNAYGRSKCEGEDAVTRGCAEHIILRTAWVHSPFGANFVKTMLRLGQEREELAVVDDQRGSPTYAPHLAMAILTIAERIVREGATIPWGVYHYANAGEASWFDVASAVMAEARAAGIPAARIKAIPSSAYRTAATRPMNSRLDTCKLGVVFGIEPPPWRLGVQQCVHHLLSASACSQTQ